MKSTGTRLAADVMTARAAKEPRLRFDRVAVSLVGRLQRALSGSVPDGKTVIVTITAPIRQASRTGAELEEKIQGLLASGRAQLKATTHGNRIQVRVLKGGTGRTARLIGFVHNPKPDPSVLFDLARSLLTRMGSGPRPQRGGRCLIIANQDGRAPVETIRQLCTALRARRVYKRLLLAESDGLRVL